MNIAADEQKVLPSTSPWYSRWLL